MKNYNLSLQSDNFNDLFIKSLYFIDKFGEWTKPRGFNCKELICPTLILTNPKNCLLTIKDRKLNYAFSIVEKFAYISGLSESHILIQYNPNLEKYINEKTNDFDGAYGPRIHQNGQLKYCYDILKRDKDSRQALITINDFTDRHNSRDIPCTMFLHFLIRDNKLDLIVAMRSNDVFLGLSYDLTAFCFIQEIMAFWLNIEAGNYIHFDSSLHYYDNNEEIIKQLVNEDAQPEYEIINLNKTNDESLPRWNIEIDDFEEAIDAFWIQEKNVRENREYQETSFYCINQYLNRLLTFWNRKYEKNR